MQLESEGILINLRPFSERDVIAYIFTKDFGLLVGMLRGAGVAKKNKPLVGQYGKVSWNARLDSQLGVFHWEAEKNLSVPIINDMERLKFMNAAFGLLGALIPEREQYENLYTNTILLLQTLADCLNPSDAYLKWEICFLQELGYALDLTKCSGCGKTVNLCYLSPRTGRAVCSECGEPYREKLYKLPVSLATTFRFISGICTLQGVDIPMVRKFF